MSFSIGSKGKAGSDLIMRNIWEIFENLFFVHAGSEILQYVIDSHTDAANAGLTATLLRIDSDAVFPVHTLRSSAGIGKDQGRHEMFHSL